MQGDVALVGPPVGAIPELLARLAAIDAALPPADGLACFNRMYQQVTVAVQGRLAADVFADPVFMERLDLVFGNLYLDAVRASVTQPERVPRSWAALLEQRGNPRIAPLQFALAGMNAHINHDLAIAVANTCRDLQSPPDAGSHRADYERINPVLADLDESVRESFETGPLLRLDRNVRTLADIVVNWDIVHARETAWANAQTLWGLRQGAGALAETYLDGLDHLVGFAGRGLLVPLVAV